MEGEKDNPWQGMTARNAADPAPAGFKARGPGEI
jgi:hypothetical protein